jgi:hypothetical protein
VSSGRLNVVSSNYGDRTVVESELSETLFGNPVASSLLYMSLDRSFTLDYCILSETS